MKIESGPGGSPTARYEPRTAFISFASPDARVAAALCAALEAAGVSCWIAARDIRAGDFYADAIVQAISDCELLVLVLSAHSSGSPHVLREVERASSKHKPLIAVRTDTTPLPPSLEYFLSATQWLDATGGVERIVPALIEAVRGRRGASAAPLAPA